ncbi:hypothetical protein ACNQ2T_01615 [Mycoplasma sp. Z407A]|uniref:hypothetical protein n=1 Tax=Mycoplasma sp. Z407A TaxID=3401678 RepID=UPI003AB0B379
MTEMQKYNIKKAYLGLYNIVVIGFILIGLISLICLVNMKHKIPITATTASMNSPVVYTYEYSNSYAVYVWKYRWLINLVFGLVLYAAQVIYLLINKNKVLYSLLPLIFINKINFANSPKWSVITTDITNLVITLALIITSIVIMSINDSWMLPKYIVHILVLGIVLLVAYIPLLYNNIVTIYTHKSE